MLLQYMVPGYLFITLYSFTTYSKHEFDNKIFSSIVISFILKVLFDFINKALVFFFGIKFGTNAYFIGLFAFCLLCAYLCARLSDSKWFKRLTSKLGVKRTINKNIWADAISPGDYLEIYIGDPEIRYYGLVQYIEEDAENPWIVLSKYYVVKPDGKKIDHTKDEQLQAMICASRITRIKITHSESTKEKDQEKPLLDQEEHLSMAANEAE